MQRFYETWLAQSISDPALALRETKLAMLESGRCRFCPSNTTCEPSAFKGVSISSIVRVNGTRWVLPAFIRAPGTVQRRASKSNSSHLAPSTSRFESP